MKIYQRGYRKQDGESEIVGDGIEVIDWWVGEESTSMPIAEWDSYNPYNPNFIYPKTFRFII